MNKSYKTAY